MAPIGAIQTAGSTGIGRGATADIGAGVAAFQQARFEFRNKTLSGQQAMQARWKRGVDEVDRTLGEATGKLYVEQPIFEQNETTAKPGEPVAKQPDPVEVKAYET